MSCSLFFDTFPCGAPSSVTPPPKPCFSPPREPETFFKTWGPAYRTRCFETPEATSSPIAPVFDLSAGYVDRVKLLPRETFSCGTKRDCCCTTCLLMADRPWVVACGVDADGEGQDHPLPRDAS